MGFAGNDTYYSPDKAAQVGKSTVSAHHISREQAQLWVLCTQTSMPCCTDLHSVRCLCAQLLLCFGTRVARAGT